MALLGSSALAMWWDIAPAASAEFGHWHAHEHFPERLGIPGFLRASRWACANGGEGVFVLYELRDHDVLGSPSYLARLNAPSPWSVRMMPLHRHMVRSQCRVLATCGAVVSRHLHTLRLSPRPGMEAGLQRTLQMLGTQVAATPGLTGLHLLRHAPPRIAATEEQRIRGLSDRCADWVVLAAGYDRHALAALAADALGDAALVDAGAAPGIERSTYLLAHAAVPHDVVDVPALEA